MGPLRRGEIAQWLILFLLCVRLLPGCLAGTPGNQDEGASEGDCDPSADVEVVDDQGGAGCTDTDGQVMVPPPAEAQAGCSAQVAATTVTATAKTSVNGSVMAASCSMENGGDCDVANSCDFFEDDTRAYVFELDAAMFEAGQPPSVPDGTLVQGAITCTRSGGGFESFPLVPGQAVDVFTNPGDSCSYSLTVAVDGTPGETGHVLATLSRTSVGEECQSDLDCENDFYEVCQPDGDSATGFSCGAGVYPDACSDDGECDDPNYVCDDGTCGFAPSDGDRCEINQDCDGEVLCDADGFCRSGRAVLLDFVTGTLQPGTPLCLSEVGPMGCTFTGTECLTGLFPTLHLHREITVNGQVGTFPDPNSGACGHGKVFGSADCGDDAIAPCF